MIDIVVTGLSGVLGRQLAQHSQYSARFGELYHTQPFLTNPVRTNQLDLTASEQLTDLLKAWQPKVLVHLAAATHLTFCQTQNGDKNGSVWQLNVEATRSIAEACRNLGIHLILLSTEAVFSGKKESYAENDLSDPISWYGTTKARAEEIVRTVSPASTILRAVTAYDLNMPETIFGTILSNLYQGKKTTLVQDHFLTPTYIPDLVKAIDHVITYKPTGTFHVASPDRLTPFKFGQLATEILGLPEHLVQATTLKSFLGSGADIRTRNGCLSSTYTESQFTTQWRSPRAILETYQKP